MPDFPMHVAVPDAVHALAALLPDPGLERVPLSAAFGRTLAADLDARVSHPSATESALDGIACREADTLGATATAAVALRVVGESRAGAPFTGTVGAGECVRIYTGAPVPTGADAICPVEQLTGDGDTVHLQRPASPRDIRHEGNDFCAGEVVMRAGVRLTPARVALAAALGHATVPVRRRLRVALLSTGDEVVAPGEPLHAGQVYDSNRFGLTGLLHDAGCDVRPLGRVPDAPDALAAQLDAVGGADLLLTSGGVSMGRYDFMRDLLIERGRVHFWKVRMRPGGPALLGEWRGLPVFGLPGNPVSALVVFHVIARPALTGQPARTVRLRAATPFRSLPDKTAYWRATVDGAHVHEYGAQGSGVLRSLSDTDALAVLPAGSSVGVGDEVDVLLL
ncbi:gephyrin-like molybdotransferase Glp [Deinococcus maricopensis]|uniref:Molybdopterin molybdenumtransferase n=1 Tax=Deinococcus maricopensis (strain DSM 21211 / LMG 22137 / NRRL B-23946 / LB-34) TaxID=709986 RepID=E8U4N3_DEIML|nr:gephyrin-like molybdotransferase Glp [Deinococcus maricopensis]ADV68898.1 molybdenum cofactor synthesis domain protein [Deinococcus maricopensis DSM 21211]